ALFVFLARCFHEPIQFTAGLCVFFHLPIPIVICERIKRSGQFTALFRTKLLDGGFNLFHPGHTLSLSASSAWNKWRNASRSAFAGRPWANTQQSMLTCSTVVRLRQGKLRVGPSRTGDLLRVGPSRTGGLLSVESVSPVEATLLYGARK